MTFIPATSYITITQNFTVTQNAGSSLSMLSVVASLDSSSSTTSSSTASTSTAGILRRIYVSDPTSSPPAAPAASIVAACQNNGTVLINGDFETAPTGNGRGAPGWTSASADPSSAYLADIAATGQDAQFTPGGARLGQLVLGGTAGNVVGYQNVTLCPATLYYIDLDLVQKTNGGACRADVSVGGTVLTQPGPQASGMYSMTYTSGFTAQDVSVWFVINMTCAGTPDGQGKFVMDLDDVTLQFGTGS